MNVFSTIDDLRQQRWVDPTSAWGLIPTMGYLHEGHLSLVRQARRENDWVAVSIFVNPIQFNNPDDLTHYPRNLEQDLALLRKEGVDVVWTPAPHEIYPPDYQTYIDVQKISQRLEGAARPGHFRGVTTIVAKLFNVFQPHRAYFGQKDAQQVVVIKQMVKDLNFNLKVIVCPTVREPDGLAMSSRNVRLSPAARQQATCLHRALTTAKSAFEMGRHRAAELHATMLAVVNQADLARVDYISVADPETLSELETIEQRALLSLAVWVDDVRLIDNIIVKK